MNLCVWLTGMDRLIFNIIQFALKFWGERNNSIFLVWVMNRTKRYLGAYPQGCLSYVQGLALKQKRQQDLYIWSRITRATTFPSLLYWMNLVPKGWTYCRSRPEACSSPGPVLLTPAAAGWAWHPSHAAAAVGNQHCPGPAAVVSPSLFGKMYSSKTTSDTLDLNYTQLHWLL